MNLTFSTALIICLFLSSGIKAQTQKETKVKPVLFDGFLVTGYVDNGAYINCTGPGVRFTKKPVSVLLGFLPGLRIKEDKVPEGASKNSAVTPSLGFGLTAAYKHLAIQVPFYYTSKTATKDGKWNPGIGIGYKF
ncbi:hypothetical protein [Arcticibacter tournemirensis]|uniref:hypothetical protein n=1 Tax=Arcticibacter tournemirensis TaxID=699437 RepID=UPI001F35BC55|nr:hypothetical protein [Arcticibacter tournemirensis]